MLEQKLCFDVAYMNGKFAVTGIFAFEMNGEAGGYGGFNILAPRRNFHAELIGLIGQRFSGKNILIGPAFPELNPGSRGEPEEETWPYIERLENYFGIKIQFAYNKARTQRQFEELGINLEAYDAIFGLGTLITHTSLEDRMINAPVIELLAWHKMMQYAVLKDVEGLNLPESEWYDIDLGREQIVNAQKRFGRCIYKRPDSVLGQGVYMLESDTIEAATAKFGGTNLSDPEEMREQLQRDGYGAMKKRLAKKGIIVQQFIEMEPAINRMTGKGHYGKARILWFGDYLGGYWSLSSNPAERAVLSDRIVTFSRTGIAQAYTPEEDEMFREWARKVIPRVLARVEEFKGTGYQDLEFRLMKEALVM